MMMGTLPAISRGTLIIDTLEAGTYYLDGQWILLCS